MERQYQQAYNDSLMSIPTFTSESCNSLTTQQFFDFYPDFYPLFRKSVGRSFSFYMSEKVNYDINIYRSAKEFLVKKREKLIEFFWNIDLGKIFYLSAIEISAISFQNTKTINYTKIPIVMEPILNRQILQLMNSQILHLLYSQKITIQRTSHSFISISYFLMNRLNQSYNYKTKENIFSMISRRVKSKFFLTKLPLTGHQYLSKGFKFDEPRYNIGRSKFEEPRFMGIINKIESHYINFMPFLQAMSSNRIYIMLFNDFKWFSQIIQTTQTTQTTSKLEKTGKLLDPELAKLIENIKSILFCESKDLCFKFSMFFVVYYAQRLLLEKNRTFVFNFIRYIFKDNPEISEIINYIMTNNKLKTLETLQETKHDYYRIIKTYGNKFCYIAGCLEDFYNGNLDLPISQLVDEEHGVMLNSASPLQKIVFYILNN